ncbi:maleylpyruvate isomerase family mycothiol-dependent enzyme [Acidothermaceae bacterium B102]|nr:maleylpyruvate isomerase family mycothiol-dependent enzyme [Acidothermaceae bacterium B102]
MAAWDPEWLTAQDRLAALEVEGRLLVDAAAAAGLDAAVPTCPGWTVASLLQHIGLVHLWATEVVQAAGPEIDQDAFDAGAVPPDDAELLDWAGAAHEGLVRALRAAPDFDGWTFWPAPTSARDFWIRRQLHETAVHRMDAELAAWRSLTPMAAGLAADGIDELLTGLLPYEPLFAAEPRSIAVALTDIETAWYVSIAARPPEIRREVAPADLTLHGTANELHTFLQNRASDGVRADGATDLVALWRQRVRISR